MSLRLIALAMLSTACLPDIEAREAVLKAGYSDVHLRYSPTHGECAGATDVHEFTAFDREKNFVHGLVCCKYDYGCVLKLK